MSSKKILRLKTPQRQRQTTQSPKQVLSVHPRCADLQAAIKTQHHQDTGLLQKTLIVEINKLYHDIEAIKGQLQDKRQINEALKIDNARLAGKIEKIEDERKMWREMYELQQQNHRQLRAFYEKREKQWQVIVMHHKSMLDQYFNQNYPHQNHAILNSHAHHQSRSQSAKTINNQKDEQNTKIFQQIENKQMKRLKRASKQNITKPEVVYYYAQMSRLYEQEKEFTLQKENEYSNRLKRITSRNADADDLFDKIMRKTLYYIRQKSLTISQIKSNEDMMKLKHAKTSTKERLAKTIKKLQFQFENEKELQFFCDYVEEILLYEHKIFKGDLAFDFLIQKLMQIERLATSSNSEIERFGTSLLQTSNHALQVKKQEMTEIKRLSMQNLELLINSVIKSPKFESQSRQYSIQGDQIDKIRYSESQIQSLSNIIYGGKFLKEGANKNYNIDGPPTVDVSLR